MLEVKTSYQFLSKCYLTKNFCNTGLSVCKYYHLSREKKKKKGKANGTHPPPQITFRIEVLYLKVRMVLFGLGAFKAVVFGSFCGFRSLLYSQVEQHL